MSNVVTKQSMQWYVSLQNLQTLFIILAEDTQVKQEDESSQSEHPGIKNSHKVHRSYKSMP